MRSPLTRAHLTQVEDRVRDLESLLGSLLPQGENIDQLLTQSRAINNLRDYTSSILSGSATPQQGLTSNQQLFPSPPPSEQNLSFRPILPEDYLLNDSINGFDWQEDQDQDFVLDTELKDDQDLGSPLSPFLNVNLDTVDGMGALSFHKEGSSGYFGILSSSLLLRTLKIDPENDNDDDFEMLDLVENLDGVKVPHINKNIEIQLNSKFVQDQYILLYFKHYHTSYPFIHKHTFIKQYNNELPIKDEITHQMLINTVLSIGCWCVNGENSNMDLYYYDKVKKLLKQINIFASGNITLLQIFILLSNYTQKRNKPNTGWNYLGLAVRMAMSLGLHKDFKQLKTSNPKQNLLNLEIRKRLWWGLYIFDAGAAITFGRPINLPSTDIIDIGEVTNINDEKLMEIILDDSIEEIPNLNQDYPTIYSGLIYQTKFTKLSCEIYNRIISKNSPTAKECLDLNDSLLSFIESLPLYLNESDDVATLNFIQKTPQHIYDTTTEIPQWFNLQRYRLIWRYKNLQIILFRSFIWQRVIGVNDPIILEQSKTKEGKLCRQICLNAASETIKSVENYTQNELSIISIWYLTYFLFQLVLIPIVCLCSEPDSKYSSDWLNDILTSKRILVKLLKFNSLLNRFIKIIDRLCLSVIDKKLDQEISIPDQDQELIDQVLDQPLFAIKEEQEESSIPEMIDFEQELNSNDQQQEPVVEDNTEQKKGVLNDIYSLIFDEFMDPLSFGSQKQ